MHHHRLPGSLLALLTATATTTAQVFPYTPTKVLLPPNASYAYIFQASTQGTGQSRLFTLPFNNPVSSAAGWQDDTVSGTLPFLRDDALIPYTPMIDALGGLTVFAGNCSEGAGGAEMWYFAVDEGTLFGNGTWTQYNTSSQGLGSTTTALAGANFLASGIAFSEVLGGSYNDTNLYIFGGMCPLANSTAETWTSAAEYSNQMLTLAPNTSAGTTDYDLSMVANRGPPIAEAGFSITPLSPTYSEAASSGSGSQKQQQDFVLLGGHTQEAFINMSQVALFSLPQESWTFLPVSQPSSAATTKTDLSARQAATVEVEPRSGHTAVLTEDGESVVLFGGWVGDVGTAAQPQLAVLRLGAGFGGTGDWNWSVLAESNSSSNPSDGLYGHGAAMLPGGVMLVVGGYAIPTSSSSSASSKRAVQSANSQIYFYNVSANTWMDTYTPPADLSPGADHPHGALSNVSQKAGLGAGLGIGAAVLIALLVFYFWYTRRLERARDARGRSLLSRSSDSSLGPAEKPMTDKSGIEGRGGDVAAIGRFWKVWDSSSNASAHQDGTSQMQEGDAAGSTALFVNIPSPTRGLRKGVAGRNYQYHAAPRYDDKRVSRGSANIPTITEHDEEEDWPLSAGGLEPQCLTDAERKLRELERVLNSPDPFSDQEPNPLGSHPVSPELAQGDTIRRISTGATFSSVHPPRRDSIADRAELPAWPPEPHNTTTTTTTASEPLLPLRQETGRTSPSKTSERTSSTLSERSAASSAGPSLTRTISSRTGTMLSAAAAAAARAAGNGSPDQQQSYYYSSSTSSDGGGGRTATMSTLGGGRKSPFYYQQYTTQRARSSTNGSMQNSGAGGPNSAGTDADSFVTARSTNFALLQSEGDALLGGGGRPSADYDDPYRRAAFATRSSTREGKTVRMYDDYPSGVGGGGGGGIPTIAPPRRRQGWMGSLRRALNAVGERSFSLTGGSVEQYGAGAEGEGTASSSPTKERGVSIGAAPRRAVSDGGTLLKQKRGQKDWEDGVWPRYRDDPDPGDWGEAVGDGQSGSLEKRRTVGVEEEEEEWDVEGAASKRDVQVMFTVPKARLRVVNADMDRASMRSASEGAVSRSGSVRILEPLHREGSGKLSLRARPEGDQAATLEEEKMAEGAEVGSGEVEGKGWGEKEKAA
ncbi:hypothetical protein LTR02_005171 [Friedmanniomyces endolithicus]|nr:hypothetical protein LTR75_003348 [Friedmanniomyces endolithicus]KAK0858612.1 hypothetical protein LTR03_000037 [Friedmanniomyces endolithicus]KAK0907981.1 hypothetical protein LTR02_005171 [Friedmanniomyces endolithicus]KAK0924835.1 hypothetical protein LTR57_005456 [Friedmanniomyces endolithicus]KAK0964097.1 hypothetical protein LTS01_019001 [Friedmanniomyces endolithicus]